MTFSTAQHSFHARAGNGADERTGHQETDLQWRDRCSAELLGRCGSGQPVSQQERDQAVEQVVEINIPIADAVARRYAGRGADPEDLTQVARLGLVQAAHRFRPESGDFHSFAIPTVTGEVKRYFRDHCWSIRPPRRMQELRHEVRTAWPQIAQERAHTPQPDEIAERVNADRSDVVEALSEGTFRLSSLDAPTLAAAETVGQPDDGYEQIDDIAERDVLLAAVQRACRRLGRDDLAILRMRYLEGHTQAVIAAQSQVSQMSISRRLARVTRTLRRLIQQDQTSASDDRPHPADRQLAA